MCVRLEGRGRKTLVTKISGTRRSLVSCYLYTLPYTSLSRYSYKKPELLLKKKPEWMFHLPVIRYLTSSFPLKLWYTT